MGVKVPGTSTTSAEFDWAFPLNYFEQIPDRQSKQSREDGRNSTYSRLAFSGAGGGGGVVSCL